jgi:hypothetical protein
VLIKFQFTSVFDERRIKIDFKTTNPLALQWDNWPASQSGRFPTVNRVRDPLGGAPSRSERSGEEATRFSQEQNPVVHPVGRYVIDFYGYEKFRVIV